MDSLAALALGTETPTPDLLDRKPSGSKARLISKVMARNIICNAAFEVVILLTMLYAGPSLLHLPYSVVDSLSETPRNKFILDTMIFNTFVCLQLFNEFNARSVTETKLNAFAGVFTNPIFVIIFVITAILQFFIIQFGGGVLETHPLDTWQWLVCVLLGFLAVPFGFINRLIPVRWFAFREPKEEERQPLLGKKDFNDADMSLIRI